MALDNAIETDDHEETETQPAKKSPRINETTSSGARDPLAAAFNEAKDELEAKAAASKPGPKPGSKRAPKEDGDDEEDSTAKAKAKPKPETDDADGKPKKETSYAKDGDAPAKGEKKAAEKADEGESDAKPAKKADEPKKTVEAKPYWSEKRKEAFRFQPREVQEQWLEADPEPDDRWPTDTKEAFKALPRDAKEVVLSQLREADKGLNQKFQALAAERKLAEDVRAAVPAHMRTYMQQRGMNEAQVLGRLLQLQDFSMKDPVGYVRKFIADNRIDPAHLFAQDGSQPNSQPSPAQQADIRSHPAFQALAADYEQLRQSIEQDRQTRAQEDDRRFKAEFDSVMAETDGEGNSLYPYIRLLAEPMAQIIEADPELFSSMGVKERFSTAYRLALQDYPELAPPKRTAKAAPPPADEPEEETDAHAETETKRAAALDKAITPKSKSMVTTPGPKAKIDSIDAAIASAKKQLNR